MADECGGNPEYVLSISKNLELAFNRITPYFWFILGLPGHIILIREFYKQSKSDRAYKYQIFLTVNNLVAIVIGSVSGIIFAMGSEDGDTAFKRVYIVQFYNAHLFYPLWQITKFNSLFLTVSLTADRVFAVTKPLIYRNINHRAIQRVAVLICFLLCVILSICDAWVFQVVQVSDFNSTKTDVYYNLDLPKDGPAHTVAATIFSHMRTGLRLMAVIILIVSNVLLMIALRRRTKKLQQITLSNEEEQKQRASADRTLLIVSICQSFFVLVNHVPSAIYSILILAAPVFIACYGGIIGPLLDAFTQFSSVMDFFVLIIVQTKIRERALYLLRWKCVSKKQTATVVDVAVRQSDQGNPRNAWMELNSTTTQGNSLPKPSAVKTINK